MEAAVRALYQQIIDGWNERSPAVMAAPFAIDGEVIGFDGSEMHGEAEIIPSLQAIWAHHVTPVYVSKVRSVRPLGADAAVLRAVVGMAPPGQSKLNPALNAHQTLVAAKRDGQWRVVLFQTTPAAFHGRPDLVERLTAELQELV